MKILTLEQHRKRIDNINEAERYNKSYTKRHRIVDYMPGQATYNLGDYPAKFSIEPTEYDYNLLKDMAESGVELIQIHEEWNDAIRHLGADKFTSHDPEGMQKFVDLCHYFGIKIIPYISTGYFHILDPDFQEDFGRPGCDYAFRSLYSDFRKCYAGSASWREYMLKKTFEAVDKYGFDGIYNDWGYDGLDIEQQKDENKDIYDIKFPYDPEIEDLLCLVYNEVKRRGGVYKVHADLNNRPNTRDRVYDYLWIGEGVKGKNFGIGKEYQPYIVPCQHMHFNEYPTLDYYYATTIPFMQFPLLKSGRPFYGEAINVPGVKYYTPIEGTFEDNVQKYMKDHPDGPYVYSLWSGIPDDVDEYPRWKKFMKLYKPMVEQSSVAYIELRDSEAIVSELPEDVYVSMFVNEDMYLVASNLTDKEYTLVLKDEWKDRQSDKTGNTFTVKPGEILFLIK
ncbi:MAG: hypothetical protein IKV88_00535 [Clostridia bacterium]|nr:hypothetical protein [Clostridia bacterium]